MKQTTRTDLRETDEIVIGAEIALLRMTGKMGPTLEKYLRDNNLVLALETGH